MTFVGKMLVVLQLVLSLLFMAFAGAVATVEKNWKSEFSSTQDDLKVEKDFHQTTQNSYNEYKNSSTTTIADLDTQDVVLLALKAHQIMSTIQTGGAVGMKTMNQSLFELYRAGTISYEDAVDCSGDPADFMRLLERQGSAAGERKR